MMRWTMGLMWACAACSSGALPELPPETNEQIPSAVRLLGVWPANGDEPIEPPALKLSRAYRLKVEVTSLLGEPLGSEALVASIESPSFERVISCGASCVTPAVDALEGSPGVCSIVFYAEGPVRDVRLVVRAQRALEVQDELALDLRADRSSARLRFVVPGVGTAVWVAGDADPLTSLRTMGLSLEEAQAKPLVVELQDAFGNPLVGERVVLSDWRDASDEGSADAGAGAAQDAALGGDAALGDVGGLDDAGAAEDTGGGAGRDAAGASDTQGVFDVGAGAGDGGVEDAAPAPPDAGAGQGHQARRRVVAQGKVRIYRAEQGACSAQPSEEGQHEARSDAQGRALFCLGLGTTSVIGNSWCPCPSGELRADRRAAKMVLSQREDPPGNRSAWCCSGTMTRAMSR